MRGAASLIDRHGSELALRDRPAAAGREPRADRRARHRGAAAVAVGPAVHHRPGSARDSPPARRDCAGGRRRRPGADPVRAVADAALCRLGARAPDQRGQPRQPAARARRPRTGGDSGGARRLERPADPAGAHRRHRAGARRRARRRGRRRRRRTRALVRRRVPARRASCRSTPRRRRPCGCSRSALAVVTGALFTAAPAWAMSRTAPLEALAGTGRNASQRSFVPRGSLLVVQVALSLVLLSSAGLLAKSLAQPGTAAARLRAGRSHGRADRSAGDRGRHRAAHEPVRAGSRSASAACPASGASRAAMYSPMEGQQLVVGHQHRRPHARSEPSRLVVLEPRDGRVFRDRRHARAARPVDRRARHRRRAACRRRQRVLRPEVLRARAIRSARPSAIGDASHGSDFAIVGVVEDVKYTGATQHDVRPMMFLPAFQAVPSTPTRRCSNVQARSMLLRAIVVQVAPSARQRRGGPSPGARGGRSGPERPARRADDVAGRRELPDRAAADAADVGLRPDRARARGARALRRHGVRRVAAHARDRRAHGARRRPRAASWRRWCEGRCVQTGARPPHRSSRRARGRPCARHAALRRRRGGRPHSRRRHRGARVERARGRGSRRAAPRR